MENKQIMKVTGSYALVKIGDPDKLVPAMEKLYFNEHVLYCDAVDGDYDLVLLLQGSSNEEISDFIKNEVKTANGVEKVEICGIARPAVGNEEKATTSHIIGGASERYDGAKAQSYLFVEVVKEHLEEVCRTLIALDAVAACDVTLGKYSLVLLVRAAGFDIIRKIIAEKIRPLPGVLRIKQSHIIKMFEM